jgi:CMP-N-acetylneuraminic acid synthetase
MSAGCDIVAVSSDAKPNTPDWLPPLPSRPWIQRPPELAQDDTPMIEVVQHAMAEIPGAPDDIWVLLQPTQPFRTSARVREAITLLRQYQDKSAIFPRGFQPNSVVSVTAIPPTHCPEMVQYVDSNGRLHGNWFERPTRRQDVRQAYRPDGTVYAFWRKTVDEWGSIYGCHVQSLILEPHETCELDTPEHWTALERRWQERP